MGEIIDAVKLIWEFFSSRNKLKDEQKKLMSKAILEAITETEIYLASVNRDRKRNFNEEASLARIWSRASSEIALHNQKISDACFDMSRFWANLSAIPTEFIEEIDILVNLIVFEFQEVGLFYHSQKGDLVLDESKCLLKLIDHYKKNLEADIHNNLVLELYDLVAYEDLCIEPFVIPGGEFESSERTYRIFDLLDVPRLAIIGEPGSGKTTALRLFALQLIRKTPIRWVPIYISLSSYGRSYSHGTASDFVNYINDELASLGGPNLDMLSRHENLKPIILLDGWDEILDMKARDLAKKFLSTTDIQFMISSRPEARRSLPYVELYKITPLNDERIKEFTQLRLKDIKCSEDFWHYLERDIKLRQLASVPLNLSIMIIVYQEEKTIELLTKTKMYERAFEAILRQHHRANPYEGYLKADEDQTKLLAHLLTTLAFQTATSGEGRFFSIWQFQEAARNVLGKVSSELPQLLAGRLGIIRDRRAGRYEFFHLWYQEFLAAHYIVKSGMNAVELLRDRRLAPLLPFVVGLIDSQKEAFQLLERVPIYDVFNFCRAIGESKLNDVEIRRLILLAISFGENSHLPVRVELAHALVLIGTSGFNALISIAKDNSLTDYARRAALEALALLQPNDNRFKQLLVQLLKSQSRGLLWHVVEHVGYHGLTAGVKKLRIFTNDEDPILAGDSLWALQQMEGSKSQGVQERISDGLIQSLDSAVPHIKGHALRTIGRLRLHKAIPALQKYLKNPDEAYRWIVPEAASNIGGVNAIKLLSEALDDKDDRVVIASLQGISRVAGPLPIDLLDHIKRLAEECTYILFIGDSLGRIARQTLAKLGADPGRIDKSFIYISRHCKTAWNLKGKLQGRQNLPLADEGKEEAKRLAQTIKNLKLNRIITSPAKRTVQTANIYGETLNIPIKSNEGFQELDHGDWEGQYFEDLLSKDTYNFLRWFENPESTDIPNGTETALSAGKRVMNSIREITSKYPNERILFVSHKHVIALFMCCLYNRPLNEFRHMIVERITPYFVPYKLLREDNTED